MFDTLTYAQELKEAGFTEAQATAQAKAFLSIAEEKLVNKQDLALLKTELMAKIDQQGQELTSKIDAQGQELTAKIGQVETKISAIYWVVGFQVALSLVMISKLFNIL